MNRSDLSMAMGMGAGITRSSAERALNAALASIVKELQSGHRITLAGFGSFRPVQRQARTGRDPRSGSRIAIAPRVTVQFTVSPELRTHLNGRAKAAVKA